MTRRDRHQEASRAQGPRFRLGKLHVTQAAVAAMATAEADPTCLLSRHQRSDLGQAPFNTALDKNGAVTAADGRAVPANSG